MRVKKRILAYVAKDNLMSRHPNIVGRKPYLDPNQKAVCRFPKGFKESEKIGLDMESEVKEMLEILIPEKEILSNLYFESGNYIESVHCYETMQIDLIVITDYGAMVFEVKNYQDEKYSLLTDGSSPEEWILLDNYGKIKRIGSGLMQNHRHADYITQLLENEGIQCPVHRITVVGGIAHGKMQARADQDGYLVSIDKLSENLKAIEFLNRDANVDVDAVSQAIKKYECRVPGIQRIHTFLLSSHFKKNRAIYKRCKGMLID